MKIKIWKSDQGGYMYNIWLNEDADEDDDCDDGGLCTGNYTEAVKMACEHGVQLIKAKCL